MIGAMLTSTVSWPEFLWMLVVTPGLFYAVRLVRRASSDFQVLRRAQINGVRDYAALTTLMLFSAVAITQLGFFVIGLLSVTQAPRGGRVSPLSWVLAGVFIMVAAVLALTTFLVEKRRQSLLDRIAAGEDIS